LEAIGVSWVGMEQLWPFLIVIVGLFSLITGLVREPRNPDSVWLGCVGLLAGALMAYITMGDGEWGDMTWLWPAFPLIAGIGWLVAWLVDLHRVAHLFLALGAMAVGIVGFLYTYGRLSSGLALDVISFWPVLLIFVGVGLIIQFYTQRR